MLERIVAAFTAAVRLLGQIGRDAVNGLPVAGKWLDDLFSSPFRVLFGGKPPLPSFEANLTKPDILEEFQHARRSASLHRVDPSGIETVRKYCTAKNRSFRDGMDLSAIQADARVLLLTMDETELGELGKAGPGQIKRFLDGKPHNIHGVPVVGVHRPPPGYTRPPETEFDHDGWKQKAVLLREIENRFKLG